MEEWKEYTLGELTTDGKGTYGIAASAVDFRAELPTYLRITDINDDGTINFSGLKSVDDPNSSKYVLQENDIVFARTGASTGRSYFYDIRDGKFVYAGFLIKFSLDPKKVNPCILKYYTHSKVYYNWVHSFENGATRGNINAKTFADMKLILPPRNVQDSIASILSSLDDKIAVNRRICENLEAQAQALFKHWFIDFAPYKNGKFVESELGMIPEGWRVVTLDEATSKFGTGLNPRQNFKLGCGKNYYVTIKNMIDNRVVLDNKCDFVDDEAIKVIQKRSKLTKGDLLFSGIGTIGRVAMVVDEPLNWNTSESVFNMHPAEGFSTEFIYVLLLSKPLQNYVKTNSQGAVQQGIRMASLKAYKFPYPQYDIKEFNDMIKDIIYKKTVIEKECDTLSALRDTLLPKLMSGEIKV